MKKDKIYITTMYRWGDVENHSYVLFAGFSKSKAIGEGKKEFTQRGGKYDYEVVEFTPDKPDSKKYIVDVETYNAGNIPNRREQQF